MHLSPKADTPEHEAKCERCGVSCHAAYPLKDGRSVVIQDLSCRFYGIAPDGKPGCTVYEERFEKAPWCLHSSRAGYMGALHEGCPYRIEGTVTGKVRVLDEEYEKLWPEIIESVLTFQQGVNPNLTWKKFIRAAERREPGYTFRLLVNEAKTSGRLLRKKTSWTRLKEKLPL